MTNQAIAVTESKTNLRTFMRSDSVMSRFSEVVGNINAGGYISSVLIAVSESSALQECSANSIVSAALRAATMRLSVEPSTGQAFIVPFKGKATLVVGYKGIYQMAIRTGKYRFVNLLRVYEGETVQEDRMTGLHTLVGGRTSDKVIGYMLYFKLTTGFEKTFYMTNEECQEHGAKYSKNFDNPNSKWKTDPQVMYKKTVMRLGLMRWGYLDPFDLQAVNAADEDIVEGEFTGGNAQGVTLDALSSGRTVSQSMAELGFEEEDYPEEPPDAKQPELEPADITSTVYWNFVLMEKKKDRAYGSKILEKNGGDFAAAYHELNK